jgi:CRISPR system Cascade subunit CasB
VSERKWDEELVERLTELAKPASPDRATLAHLRRGLERPLDYTLGPVGWLFRRVPDSKDDKLIRNAILAASLFAWVKGDCAQTEGENFGKAFGSGLTQEEKQQRQKRFIDLLDTDTDELPYKLRQAITLIARESVGLDWRRLIWDLTKWGDPDRRVQKEWARDFWRIPKTEPTSYPEPTVTE